MALAPLLLSRFVITIGSNCWNYDRIFTGMKALLCRTRVKKQQTDCQKWSCVVNQIHILTVVVTYIIHGKITS